MNIKIVAVGKLKKNYIREGVCDYSKRLSKYEKLDIIEVKDEKTDEKMSESESQIIKEKEGARILSNIGGKFDKGSHSFVVCLDMRGKHLTTEQFAQFISDKKMGRVKDLVFVIGGSIGLADDVLAHADYVLAFSKMTFPHGLMRLVLLEQIYRAERVICGEPYHK